MRSLVHGLVVVVLAIAAAAFVSARQMNLTSAATEWDYRVFRLAEPVTDDSSTPLGELTRLGREGWDLVGVTRRQIQSGSQLQTETIFYLKRPVLRPR
jgi:hypothetical protein